ncbi:hypothetical protein CEP54_010901 [Fusarium duplospermum]|uniref:Uncharacterized protein n=1 Tax=Fusarium duplospermum TaxID=1325734 RepID=A0A428PHB3_9HYPO|nr:hypothetical protein CEP54_010901 [Fusarium duplospermum]
MAEVIVGFVSAGVGIAAFALQISNTIDALRQTRLKPGEARRDLTGLLERLEILLQAVSLLEGWEGHQPVDNIIQHIRQRYGTIEPTLRDLLEKYQDKGDGHGRHWKRAQSILARHPKQQIRDLREDINDLINILNLAFLAAQCRPPTIQEPTPRAKTDALPSGAQQEDVGHPGCEGDTKETKTGTNTAINPSSTSHQEHRIVLSTARTNSNASGARKYSCSCHLTGVSGRFWFLQYTPLSSFFGKPNDRPGCRCISLRLRMALSRFGVPYAIVAGIGFMVDGSGVELRPALRAERIVNYTSPGFEIIWRLENCLISLPEARQRFIELHQSNGPLGCHKDPSGNSYIKTLLQHPWKGLQNKQFDLLHLLITECEVTLADETERQFENSFLVQCARWIGEGQHLTLLDAILEYGFDATAIHASPADKWPAQCSPDWFGSGHTQDPFFIEYVRTILSYSPSYSGSTSLHNVLLNGSTDSAAYWLQRSQSLENNVNFLGQTPLHIVTTRPELCPLVLDTGHDMDVTDKFGVTPLMYAAAMGQTYVAKLLILKGANTGPRDTRRQWTFLDYAFFCEHWDLALDALLTIKITAEPTVFQLAVRYALVRALGYCTALTGDVSFLPKVVRLSDDVNFTFGDGLVTDNNLMHYASDLEMASTLVQCGFNSFNQKNSEGKLAINSLAKLHNAPLIKFCLEQGTDVGNVSHAGRTIFSDILSGLNSFSCVTWDIVDSIKLCLAAGADPFAADDCMCPCSPDGCHISSMFKLDFSAWSFLESIPGLMWTFEFLTLLEEYRGIEATERMLLSLIRRAQCDEPHTSIAHVCCHRGHGIGRDASKVGVSRLQSEDIGEILDEEKEFIAALEMNMKEFASFDMAKLRTEFMVHLKGKYDKHIESTKRERKRYAPNLKSNDLITYEVDYKTDQFKQTFYYPGLGTHSIAKSIAEYGFWLQHERLRADKPLVRDFHKTGWFERRISWFLEFMDVMEVTVEMLEKSMGSMYVTETRTEKIDGGKTVRSFVEAIQKARNKDQ